MSGKLPPSTFDDEPTQPVPPEELPLAGVGDDEERSVSLSLDTAEVARPAPRSARDELDDILRAAHAIEDPSELYAMLAEKAPIALAEVACGARAPGGPAHARAALRHTAILEAQLSARGFYPRLADLAGEAALDVLRVAAERHPAAGWIVKLSRKVEGTRAGATHLVAAAGHPSFAQACAAHAEAGHIEGLMEAAGTTGRPEPAGSLVSVDAVVAARAAALALNADPSSSVVAHLAAAWGPEPDPLISKVVSHLRSRAAAEALLRQSRHLPHTLRLLRAVIPGMAG